MVPAASEARQVSGLRSQVPQPVRSQDSGLWSSQSVKSQDSGLRSRRPSGLRSQVSGPAARQVSGLRSQVPTSSFRPRVKFQEGLLEPRGIGVGIELRCVNGGVSKEFLNHAQVGAMRQ